MLIALSQHQPNSNQTWCWKTWSQTTRASTNVQILPKLKLRLHPWFHHHLHPSSNRKWHNPHSRFQWSHRNAATPLRSHNRQRAQQKYLWKMQRPRQAAGRRLLKTSRRRLKGWRWLPWRSGKDGGQMKRNSCIPYQILNLLIHHCSTWMLFKRYSLLSYLTS